MKTASRAVTTEAPRGDHAGGAESRTRQPRASGRNSDALFTAQIQSFLDHLIADKRRNDHWVLGAIKEHNSLHIEVRIRYAQPHSRVSVAGIPSAPSLEPLKGLTNLSQLYLNDAKGITSLEPLKGLGVQIYGASDELLATMK